MSAPQRYLVTVTRRQDKLSGASRKFIWEGEGRLPLDHPTSWHLERSPRGLRLLLKNDVRELPEDYFDNDAPLELPLDEQGGAAMLTLRKAPKLRPAYMPAAQVTGEKLGSALWVTTGSMECLSGFDELSRKYTGRLDSRKIFVVRRKKQGYELKARVEGLTLSWIGQTPVTLKRKEARFFGEAELESLQVAQGLNWWRIGRVAERPLLALSPTAPSESEREQLWFKELNKKLAIGFVAASLLLMILPKAKDTSNPANEEPLPPTTLVQLKKPRVIEKVVVHSAPAPEPVALAPTKPAFHKKAAPPKKLAQLPPPKPVPAPAPVVPKVDEAAIRAKQQAIAKANLSKSLNFLASAPAKSVLTPNRDDARYKTLAQAVPRADGSPEVLSKLAKTQRADGPIQTQGARTMDSKVALAGSGQGKTLNEVQGRVSLSALATSGDSGERVDSLLSSKGISVGGSGALAQSEIERALSKHLQRFQYCYEKALLTDSSLVGHVLVQWTIGGGGSASDLKVLRSQLNNAQLHQCLLTEIGKVHFPAPQGGDVVVKYPFAFSSTAL